MQNHLRKHHVNWRLFILLMIANCIRLDEGSYCTGCLNTILGRENEIITFGPSDEYRCNCHWRIPKSIDTDDNTAVVLLLQNVSLPMASGSGQSTDCSASIRFPGTDGYKCTFPHNYCLTFATGSTICNINKINANIPVSNHTCVSLITWSKAGGSPYKILYVEENFAGYTKYFTIQYLVIACSNPTTTITTVEGATKQQTTTVDLYTTKISNITDVKTYEPMEAREILNKTTQLNTIEITEHQREDCSSSSITAGMLGTTVGLVIGTMIGLLTMHLVQRYQSRKQTGNKNSTELQVTNQKSIVRKRTTYENYVPTANESGYEVPIQVDNKNESQYEIITSGKKENPYDN